MNMMIKASDAECRHGIARAEMRYQMLAKAAAETERQPVATILQLNSNARREQANIYNPTGRIQLAIAAG